MTRPTIAYAALGRNLHLFHLDVASGGLAPLQTVTTPAVLQYAWPNRARTLLYVISSDAGPMMKVKRPDHFVQVFAMRSDGTLAPHGPEIRLANRPLYVSLDATEEHVLIAYNDPPDVTVHRIGADGSIGQQVAQPALGFGPTVHQVRVTPPGNIAVVPCCAHHPNGALAGSVGLYGYSNGRLAPLARMAADPARAAKWEGVRNGAHGFAARHVDFHPTRPWMYLCVERQGEIRLYDYDERAVALTPRAIASTLEGAPLGRSMQLSSGIHVHPNGRFVYVSNRSREVEKVGDVEVFSGGTNDVAVFAIDPQTGVPTFIQRVDTLGIFPRTFGIDESGRVMVVGNQEALTVRTEGGLRRVVPSLAVFRIADDGRLALLHKHDFADGEDVCWWASVTG